MATVAGAESYYMSPLQTSGNPLDARFCTAMSYLEQDNENILVAYSDQNITQSEISMFKPFINHLDSTVRNGDTFALKYHDASNTKLPIKKTVALTKMPCPTCPIGQFKFAVIDDEHKNSYYCGFVNTSSNPKEVVCLSNVFKD